MACQALDDEKRVCENGERRKKEKERKMKKEGRKMKTIKNGEKFGVTTTQIKHSQHLATSFFITKSWKQNLRSPQHPGPKPKQPLILVFTFSDLGRKFQSDDGQMRAVFHLS